MKPKEWYEDRKKVLSSRNLYRCSLVLNDVPYRGDEYYGFRIVAFAHKPEILNQYFPDKMHDKLIDFIEECLHYKEGDFWFCTYLSYMGKEKPTICNAFRSENLKYYCIWTKRKTGSIMKQKQGSLTSL